MSKIYITGLGQVSHLGNNVEEALNTFKNPSPNSILKLKQDHLESEDFPNFTNATEELEKLGRDSRKLNRANQLLIQVTKEAMAQSNLSVQKINNYKVGIIVGTTICINCLQS